MTHVMNQPGTAESFDLDAEHDALRALPIEALRRRYLEVGGHATRTRNREYLVRRILWLRQATGQDLLFPVHIRNLAAG